jgi:hypothetical protein
MRSELMKRIGILTAMFFTLVTVHGQSSSMNALEDSVAKRLNTFTEIDLATAKKHSEAMQNFIEEFAQESEIFDYAFDHLQLMKLRSSDGRVRLFTWNYPNEDGTQNYFGIALFRKDIKSRTNVYKFHEVKTDDRNWVNKIYSEGNWPGALYFQIIPMQKKKNESEDSYLLLGWDGLDNLTNRKMIDVINFQGNHCKFGASLFEIDGKPMKRVVYTFSERASMTLRYYPKKSSIVVDHVAPREPQYEGFYPEYGPDGSYDAFKYTKGKWEYTPIIDIAPYVDEKEERFMNPRP